MPFLKLLTHFKNWVQQAKMTKNIYCNRVLYMNKACVIYEQRKNGKTIEKALHESLLKKTNLWQSVFEKNIKFYFDDRNVQQTFLRIQLRTFEEEQEQFVVYHSASLQI